MSKNSLQLLIAEESEHAPRFYEFDAFRLDPGARLLWRGAEVVPLMPKAFDVLLALVRHHGEVVTKDELLANVWHDAVVEENSLNVNVSALRKVFGEKPREHRFIVTVPGVGYKFVADVREVETRLVFPPTTAEHVDETLTEKHSSDTDSNIAPSLANSASGERLSWRNYKRLLLFASVTLVVLVIVGFGWSHRMSRLQVKPETRALFQTMRLTKLTSGKALQSAVSPDGKQVAYVLEEPEGQSLWLRQVAIDSSVRLIPPRQVNYLRVAFGRDGDFIYYTMAEPNQSKGSFYEIAALGGATRRLLSYVDTPAVLSHDGRLIAFFRQREEKNGETLVVANSDGANERRVLDVPQTENWTYSTPPAWSPDDTRLACVTGSPNDKRTKFIAIRLSDGGTEALTTGEWNVGTSMEWTNDGLIVAAQHDREDWVQLWKINPADGTAQKLTNNQSDYYSVSLSKDGGTLATIQTTTLMNVWIASMSEPGNARQITSGAGTYYDVAYTPEGKVLYSSRMSGLADIWQMDADGENHRQLTRNAGSNYGPVASPDGRYLFFHSNRNPPYLIYRTRADGSEPQRLTDETVEEASADCTPDGKTVVFVNYAPNNAPLKRVPVEGGTPTLLNDKVNGAPVVSPDGNLVAVWQAERWTEPFRLALISLSESGSPVKIISVSPSAVAGGSIRWTPDGHSLLYIDTRAGVSNIWRQPLDGGKPVQVTDFKIERIFSFDVSRDGKSLVCARGTLVQDVVLFGGEVNR